MSLFGAARKTLTFQRAKERMEKAEAEFGTAPDTSVDDIVSSRIGAQMIIARDLKTRDRDSTDTTSEINREGREEEGEHQRPALVLPKDLFNGAARMQN